MDTFNLIAGVASIAGLAFSMLAFVQARRASVAATQARDAVTHRVVADELELACVRAEQLVDFIEHDRLEEAALRVAELTSALSELPRRRTPYLHTDQVNSLMTSREQVASIGAAIKAMSRTGAPAFDSDHVASIARQASMALREILGEVKSRLDTEVV